MYNTPVTFVEIMFYGRKPCLSLVIQSKHTNGAFSWRLTEGLVSSEISARGLLQENGVIDAAELIASPLIELVGFGILTIYQKADGLIGRQQHLGEL